MTKDSAWPSALMRLPLKLGLGAGSLMGSTGRKQSLRLIEKALDLGIGYFDTAPSYGYGLCEDMLGEALVGKRGAVILATKFGIEPVRNPGVLPTVAGALRPLWRAAPVAKRLLARSARGLSSRSPFTPQGASRSLERSLRALRTDYIDIFLLHEAEVANVNDDIRAFLEDSVQAGKIRAWGAGSVRERISPLILTPWMQGHVAQYEQSLMAPPFPHQGVIVTHGAIRASLPAIAGYLKRNPGQIGVWSSALGFDVRDSDALGSIALAASVLRGDSNVVLVSSRRAKILEANVRAVDDRRAGPAETLAALVQSIS